MVWSTVGGAQIQAIGWSATYLVFGALSLVTLPFTLFCMASSPEDRHQLPVGLDAAEGMSEAKVDAAYEATGITAGKAQWMPSFLIILGIAFLLNFGMYVYYVVPSYAASLSLSAVFPLLGATASSAAMAGQTISKVILGGVGERHPYPSAMVAVGLGAVGIACLAFGGESLILFYAGAFAFGVYYGVANVMLPIFTRHAFGLRDHAKIYSRISMAATAGLTITGFVWGTLVDVTGFGAMFIGVAAFILLALVLISLRGRASKQ